ncbi:MAG: hypothetical protein ACR2JB_18240 [Bryobacteraceae bacterium]
MSVLSLPLPPLTESTWTDSNAKRSHVLSRLPVSILRLLLLLEESGEDDHGQIGPTQFAFKTALLLVWYATQNLNEDVPGSPVVDSEGGIRITWSRYNKQIKLVCPATSAGQLYIYQSSPSGSSVRNENVTAAVLADRLYWLISRESAAAG